MSYKLSKIGASFSKNEDINYSITKAASQKCLQVCAKEGLEGLSNLNDDDRYYLDKAGINADFLAEDAIVSNRFTTASETPVSIGTCPEVEVKITVTLLPHFETVSSVPNFITRSSSIDAYRPHDAKGTILQLNGKPVAMIKRYGEPILFGLTSILDKKGRLALVRGGVYIPDIPLERIKISKDKPGWNVFNVNRKVKVYPVRMGIFGTPAVTDLTNGANKKIDEGIAYLKAKIRRAESLRSDNTKQDGFHFKGGLY